MFYDEIAKQNKEAVNWNKRLWNAINNPKPVKCTDCRYMGKINGKYGNCKELRSKHNVTSVRECIWFEKSIKISTDKFKADYALHNKAYRQSNNNQISKVNNSKENHIADMGELVRQSNKPP
jgi:hypothetical protein